ncbi:hypothetical protein TNCV_2196831 [Trichonephila clavipes]|nr:hypothetical protein TNCV_2196831 [Trichonephila clavipes]
MYSTFARHGGSLNNRRVTIPLVRLVAGDKRWEAPDPPLGYPLLKLGWNRAKLYCHLYGAQDYGHRQACIQPFAMMDFVGLDLTTSDR